MHRSLRCAVDSAANAEVAQLVERRLPKPKVAGSRPVFRFADDGGRPVVCSESPSVPVMISVVEQSRYVIHSAPFDAVEPDTPIGGVSLEIVTLRPENRAVYRCRRGV